MNPETIPYFVFDNGFFPYGDKASEVIKERVVSVVTTLTSILDFDMVVVACNTASTIALDALREKLDIPIVGVVPAIKPAAKLTKKGIIGLLATPGTVGRVYTHDLIRDFAEGVKVLNIGTTDLVRLAEKKLAGVPFSNQEVAKVLEPWMNLSESEKPDVIVLGCTHFPHLKKEIQECLPNALLIDSGKAVARRVYHLLHSSETSSNDNSPIFAPELYLKADLKDVSIPKIASSVENTDLSLVECLKDHKGRVAFFTDVTLPVSHAERVFKNFGFRICAALEDLVKIPR